MLLSPCGGDRCLGGGQGLLLDCRLTACSGPRQLALLGNGQCGVGLRRMMVLAAPASWDNLTCSGLQRVAQPGCGLLVQYKVERWRKRLPWLAVMAAVARCEGKATRRSRNCDDGLAV